MVTPVAKLSPVFVGGATVSRATLHNLAEIRRLDIRVGDTIIVRRAGDVIPQVMAVNTAVRGANSKPYRMPEHCPECGSLIEISAHGEIAHCTGRFICTAQLKQSIKHFASRNAMNIIGLGDRIIDTLTYKGLIANVADLYSLTEPQLLTLRGFKKRSADRLLRAIHRVKKVELSRFIYALGIPHVGESTAQLLAKHYTSLSEYSALDEEALQELPGIGAVIAKSICKYFAAPATQTTISRLMAAGVEILAECPEKQILLGDRVVITGTLSSMSRKQVKTALQSLGAQVSSVVSAKTDYVVVGVNPGKKKTAATRLGVKTIDEQQLLELLDGWSPTLKG